MGARKRRLIAEKKKAHPHQPQLPLMPPPDKQQPVSPGGSQSGGPSPAPAAVPAPIPDPMPLKVRFRLSANLVLGVSLLMWLRAFTDWGEGFTTLLALGGVFSWVAVVGKILPKPRQEQIQQLLADWLLETRKAWGVVGALIVFFLVTSGIGVVEVSNIQGGGDTTIRSYRAGRAAPDPPEDERLTVGGRSRWLYWVSPIGTTDVRVKASRLPTKQLQIRPWWRTFSPTPVQVTGSFLRPVVLVVGGEQALVNIEEKYQLRIFVDNQKCYDEPYDGTAVLVGSAETDLQIPEKLRTADGWKEVFGTYESKLLPPRGREWTLDVGKRVYAVLLKSDGKAFITTNPILVRPVWEIGDMIQGLLVAPPRDQ